MVVVDSKNVRFEKKGCPGESERKHRNGMAWNDVGGNQRGFVSLSEELINHEVVGE
jgi:hypothetical protein